MTESTFSESDGAEVWIYVRGRLVMKRWLRTGVSATLHVAPSGQAHALTCARSRGGQGR